jgi:hypothetical protein
VFFAVFAAFFAAQEHACIKSLSKKLSQGGRSALQALLRKPTLEISNLQLPRAQK